MSVTYNNFSKLKRKKKKKNIPSCKFLKFVNQVTGNLFLSNTTVFVRGQQYRYRLRLRKISIVFGVPGASKGHGSRSNRSSSQSASSMLNGMMLKLLHSSIAPSTKVVYRQAYLSYSKFHQTHFSDVPTLSGRSVSTFHIWRFCSPRFVK